MKFSFLALSAYFLIFSFSAFSISGSLDGATYCRVIRAGGSLGQPRGGTRNHCLSFQGGVATNNARTFFGNPPESFTYDVVNSEIVNVDTNKATGYVVKGNNIVIKETGAVLKKVE